MTGTQPSVSYPVRIVITNELVSVLFVFCSGPGSSDNGGRVLLRGRVFGRTNLVWKGAQKHRSLS